jgi:hypothetical protein
VKETQFIQWGGAVVKETQAEQNIGAVLKEHMYCRKEDL